MLEGVVTKGTAKVVKSKLFSIAGKTGTAQIAVDGKYRDAQGRTHHQISFWLFSGERAYLFLYSLHKRSCNARFSRRYVRYGF